MVWGRRREEGSGWGTHVYLWWIHFDIWQNQYNIVKFKNKIKLKKKTTTRKRRLLCLQEILPPLLSSETSPFLRNLKEMRLDRPFPETPLCFQSVSWTGGIVSSTHASLGLSAWFLGALLPTSPSLPGRKETADWFPVRTCLPSTPLMGAGPSFLSCFNWHQLVQFSGERPEKQFPI